MDWHTGGTYSLDGRIFFNASAAFDYLLTRDFPPNAATEYLRLLRSTTMFTQVRAKIEKGWCQRHYATTADGRSVHTTDPEATNWCLIGAIYAVASPEHAYRLLRTLEAFIGSVPVFNDRSTKDQVLALLDKVIKEETK